MVANAPPIGGWPWRQQSQLRAIEQKASLRWESLNCLIEVPVGIVVFGNHLADAGEEMA